ncbi:MAG: hypothetical protein AMJ72_10255 [Acidithiobacillales bacterium SM1_46]|nr:MAG: hypothetical protein AMJ72_10255 [Acidithiobacillales bacterium SM1_46]
MTYIKSFFPSLTNLLQGVLVRAEQAGVRARSSAPKSSREERIPTMQRILDNPFLLLFLGVVVPAVLYILWGVMEIVQIPIAK